MTRTRNLSASRSFLVLCMLLAATICLHRFNREAAASPHCSLAAFPMIIGEWRGADVPLSPAVIQSANADDYLNRRYAGRDGAAVELYVGFYRTQRADKWMHSPKNCLPGAGWEAVSEREIQIQVPHEGPGFAANDYIVQNGLGRMQVFYWYQGRGRKTANEYKSKFWLMYDAAMSKRTDGALVRVIAPVDGNPPNARASEIAFVKAICPILSNFVR